MLLFMTTCNIILSLDFKTQNNHYDYGIAGIDKLQAYVIDKYCDVFYYSPVSLLSPSPLIMICVEIRTVDKI